jgi:hypothetical protein
MKTSWLTPRDRGHGLYIRLRTNRRTTFTVCDYTHADSLTQAQIKAALYDETEK